MLLASTSVANIFSKLVGKKSRDAHSNLASSPSSLSHIVPAISQVSFAIVMGSGSGDGNVNNVSSAPEKEKKKISRSSTSITIGSSPPVKRQSVIFGVGTKDDSAIKTQLAAQKKELLQTKKALSFLQANFDKLKDSTTRLLEVHQKKRDLLANHLQCPICLEQLVKPYSLSPCGHIACLTCLLTWFHANSNPEGATTQPLSNITINTCPICRTKIHVPSPSYILESLIELLPSPSADPSRTMEERLSQMPSGALEWNGYFLPELHVCKGCSGLAIDGQCLERLWNAVRGGEVVPETH